MPGRSLNDNERRLREFWHSPPSTFLKPILRGIDIFPDAHSTGIRGIKGLIVDFNYPVTVICGKNGVGKTTLLSLAALAHHPPSGWFCYRGVLYIKEVHSDRDHYVFPDFFFNGHEDQQTSGVKIRWRYWQSSKKDFEMVMHKNSNRWMRYESRPEREVDYIPVSRVIPSNEVRPLRNVFRRAVNGATIETLDEDFIGHLSYIIGKEYTAADIQHSRRHSLKRCQANCKYTGFNMGAGESCIIELLSLLQRIPIGGLVVIEEVELGLHPEGQIRLAEKLIEISFNKKIQIICSSHSEDFVDAVPREARILLMKNGEDHDARHAPATRFAMHEVKGTPHPELQIYCEDEFAANLIKECIPCHDKVRINVISIGGGVSLARQAVSHERSGFDVQALTIFDGDCTDKEIDRWIDSEKAGNTSINPQYLKLPGDNIPPEKWALNELIHPDYLSNFSNLFGCTEKEAKGHIEAMSVEQDHHNIAHRLQERTGIESNRCVQKIAEALAAKHPQFDDIRTRVNDLLEN